MIYRGQVEGKDHRSVGGGTNHQCLPDDPEYNPKAPGAGHSMLRATLYRIDGEQNYKRVPCVACETNQRVNQIMIPGKTRCPSADWTVEYQGYIMSQAEHNGGGNDLMGGIYYATSYICVDAQPEAYTNKYINGNDGNLLYFTNAACSGYGSLENCPPCKNNPTLSCVVCTK